MFENFTIILKNKIAIILFKKCFINILTSILIITLSIKTVCHSHNIYLDRNDEYCLQIGQTVKIKFVLLLSLSVQQRISNNPLDNYYRSRRNYLARVIQF
jgi:hypothetical protein